MNWKPEIDIHCHILPDWDDGPKTLEISLEMCERAAKSGLKTIVATPHIGRSFGSRKRRTAEIADAVAQLQEEINSRNIPIQIVTGGEILMGAVDLNERLPHDVALTYGAQGIYALIESPYPNWPDFGGQVINEMLSKKVRPILAHPERYPNVQKDVSLLDPLIRQNALLQITAGAITGEMGKPGRLCAHKLLKNGWVSFISSDAHNTEHTLPIDAVEEVVKLIGEDAARKIFFENPRKMLAGERVTPGNPPMEEKQSGGLFKRLFKR